jgi:hypothetical protein
MQDFSQNSPLQTTHRRSVGFIYILPTGLLVGFLLFAVTRFMTGDISLPAMTTQTISPTPPRQLVAAPTAASTKVPETAPESSPTKGEVPDKASLTIQVLNGSGAAGAAGKMATLLKTLGYTKVTTGNADAYTYKNVTIRRPASQAGAAEALKEDLEKTYIVTESETKDLPSDAAIEIIVGKIASAATQTSTVNE